MSIISTFMGFSLFLTVKVRNLQRGKLDIEKHFDKPFNTSEELATYLKEKKIRAR